MPKKKVSKKRKAPAKDWGATDRVTWVFVEIRNHKWTSMRSTTVMRTTETLETVRRLIVDQHKVPGGADLRLFLGVGTDPECEFEHADFGLRLEELKMTGGSLNDRVVAIVTYQHAPFDSALRLPPLAMAIPVAALPQGMSTHIPRGIVTAAMLAAGVERTGTVGTEGDEGGDADEDDT